MIDNVVDLAPTDKLNLESQSPLVAWAEAHVAGTEARFDAKYRDYMAATGDLSTAGIEAWITRGCPAIEAPVASLARLAA